ncbi:MAG: hypothetical protein IJ088_07900 [Clostridia bacterium]|nr:hypothetical protein [Clostridia bacterium]
MKFKWADWKDETCRRFTVSALVKENPDQSKYIERKGENYKNLSKQAVEKMDREEQALAFTEPDGDYRAAVIGVYSDDDGQPDPEFFIGVRMETGKAVAAVPYFYNSVLPFVTTTIDRHDRIIGSMMPGAVEWVEGELLDRFDGFMRNVGWMLENY